MEIEREKIASELGLKLETIKETMAKAFKDETIEPSIESDVEKIREYAADLQHKEVIKIGKEEIASVLDLKPETIAAAFKDETRAASIVADAEKKVIELAEHLYCILVEEPPSPENKRTTFLMEEGIGCVKDWLDQKLPLLLSCLYVPLSDKGLTERHQAIEQVYRKRIPKLAKAWRENSPFILADMETTMAEMFGSPEGATEEKHKAKAAIPSLDSSDIPGHFADLHRLLN